jgi:hypothetical protein
MSFSENHPVVQQMLAELHRHTGGDPSGKVSMYDLGQALGIDREEAQEAGQALLGAGLAPIVSLSGSIRITAEGRARVSAGGEAANETDGVRLGAEPVLSAALRQALENATARLKGQIGQRGWAFDPLSEIMADLKTLDAQLQSPRPKTAIVRACLQSITALLERTGATDLKAPVAALMGK